MAETDPIYSDVPMVRELLAVQAPAWAGLRLRSLPFEGTDNALYVLGEDKLVRLPKRQGACAPLIKEQKWLPFLQSLPLEVPKVLLAGQASPVFPHAFGVYAWIQGTRAMPEALADPQGAAQALGAFLSALRALSTQGAPRAGPANHRRGVPLDELGPGTRAAIACLADEIDAAAALDLWNRACATPTGTAHSWIHGDLKPDNLLARDGQLVAVIDWGLAAVGDPATDIAAAWTCFDPAARPRFQEAAATDDAMWLRAQGWALYGAVIALSFYRTRNGYATLCHQCRATLHRLGLMQGGPQAA